MGWRRRLGAMGKGEEGMAKVEKGRVYGDEGQGRKEKKHGEMIRR